MTVILADGGPGDLEAVMQVMTDAFGDRYGEAWTRSQCAGILPMNGVKLALARDEADRVLGFALFRTMFDDAELLLLAVGPEAQRSGVGHRLVEHFVDEAKNKGANRIHLEVRDGNPAVRLYEAMGFVQSNRRRNYYRALDGSEHDALTFVLATQS